RNEQYKLSLAEQYMVSGKYDEAIAGFEQLRSSPNAAVARMATEQVETAKAWKDKPMLSLAALPDGSNSQESAKWQRKPGEKKDPELEKLEEAQHGGGEDHGENQAPAAPVKFLKGTLVRVDCKGELQPSAV